MQDTWPVEREKDRIKGQLAGLHIKKKEQKETKNKMGR